jgi:drug/metabolite transporter (DMT)-like permease
MLARFVGLGLVMVFGLSQAFRDVYFANVFQGIDFFAVILLAFLISALVFGTAAIIRAPGEFTIMAGDVSAVVWMNVTTALAWISYFYSLKHLQPSIVNTLHSGMGPLTLIALAAFGIRIAEPGIMRRRERLCHAGLAVSLVFLWWVVLAGHSGLPTQNRAASLVGTALPIVSGASITISLLFCKRLNERGIGSDVVTAGRYILIILVALTAQSFGNLPSGIDTVREFTVLALATTALIVFPLYSLQLGIARTSPVTAHVIRSLGPVFIFALELVDGRVAYSGFALFGIALYSFFSIAGNLVRGLATGAPIAAHRWAARKLGTAIQSIIAS